MIITSDDIAKLSAIRRLPVYLERAMELKAQGENATLTALSRRMNLEDRLIKKDLCSLGAGNAVGPYAGTADMTELLQACMENIKPMDAVMIADGLLGRMLMDHFKLLGPGVNMLVAFDADEKTGGQEDVRRQILPLYKFADMVERLQVKCGILCVPHAKAQQYAMLMKTAGITAIWNWSGAPVPPMDNVAVFNEDPATKTFDLFEGA